VREYSTIKGVIARPAGRSRPTATSAQRRMRTTDGRPTATWVGRTRTDISISRNLADRRADKIISRGANIYPAEIEAALDEHPTIALSACLRLADEELGQRLHATVEVRPGCEAPAAEELEQFLAARLARYKLPYIYEISAEPLRESGLSNRNRGAASIDFAPWRCPKPRPRVKSNGALGREGRRDHRRAAGWAKPTSNCWRARARRCS
jgi:hypothetical protein